MQIKCFLCENTYRCSNDHHFDHLKNYTLLFNVLYKCTIKDCYQQFHQKKKSFKRHVLKHFQSNTQVIVITQNDDVMECSANIEIIINVLESFNYKGNVTQIYVSADNFVIKLHSINHFSRSDVNNIRSLSRNLILY